MKKAENLNSIVEDFKKDTASTDRYTSFDYCYNYFRNRDNIKNDIEKSCLVLGFYLASWGMLRGSSFLLQKSAKHFQKLIEYYADIDQSFWQLDIDNYNEDTNLKILELYNKTKEKINVENRAHLTLTTKILLGVFGCIPAYDQYFCNTFKEQFKGKCGFTVVNKNSLNCLKEFYEVNQESIDKLSNNTYTMDFLTEKKTDINYPKAKIVDMFGFTNGIK